MPDKVKCRICEALGESYTIDTWDGPRRTGPCELPTAFPPEAKELRIIRFGRHEAAMECPLCGTCYEECSDWDNEVGDTHHHVELKRLSPRAAKKLVRTARELFEKRLGKMKRNHAELIGILSDEEINFLDYQIIRMGMGLYAGNIEQYFGFSSTEEERFIKNLEEKGVIYKDEDPYGGTHKIAGEWESVFLDRGK